MLLLVSERCRLAGIPLVVFFGLALFSAGGTHVAKAGVNSWTTSWPAASVPQTLAPGLSGQPTIYAGAFGPVLFGQTGDDWIEIANGTGSNYRYVNAIAVDPRDSKTIYVAVSSSHLPPLYPNPVTGGVYKSTDAGQTWLFIDVYHMEPVVSVVVDPANEGTVYALASFCTCTSTPFYCGKLGESCAASIYKSTDSGATWTRLGAFADVSDLIIDPIVPSTLYVRADGGLFKSLDGGLTWKAANSGFGGQCSPGILAISHSDPSVLFVATWSCPTAVYKTTDGGITWKPTALTRAAAGSPSSIAVDPTNENVVYLGTYKSDFLGGGLFRSLDGGNSWSRFDEGLPDRYSNLIAIDHDGNSIHVLLAGNGVFDYTYALPLRSRLRAIPGHRIPPTVPPR